MKVKEIGSAFHSYIFTEGSDNVKIHNNSYFYGCGRCAINALIRHHLKIGEWKRLFVPEYFCYEVIDSIRTTGIEIVFYPDYPFAEDDELIRQIKFIDGDVILRMNYFGIRGFRNNSHINAVVIEDHSHDLFSDWAINSNADWCFASLRKTLPIPDGGILWSSNKNVELIQKPLNDGMHTKLIEERCRAMEMKSLYLNSEGSINKNEFLEIFRLTEEKLGDEKCPSLSIVSRDIIKKIPNSIIQKKENNYQFLLQNMTSDTCLFLEGEEKKSLFSFIILFTSKLERDLIREKLIQKNIYPTLLWEINNEEACDEVKGFSDRMLSLPIDFRYSESDMIWMSQVVNSELLKLKDLF